MYSAIENMPGRSRIWIYPSSRQLTTDEVSIISDELNQFCEKWSAHGHQLLTSYKIIHKRFILLSVDEEVSGASGCSIDSSVHLIQNLGKQFNIDFFDRTAIPFLINGEVTTYPIKDLKTIFLEGRIGSKDYTFDLLTPTLEQWNIRGILTVENSWLSRYLPQAV